MNYGESWKSPFKPHWDEEPITRVVPYDGNAEAFEILEVRIPKNLETFVKACHRTKESNDMDGDVVEAIGRGKTLWQAMEVIQFSCRFFVSRQLSHQLVRQRVGVTFSQQCTGDMDCRHLDLIAPTSVPFYETLVENLLRSKQFYANLVDSRWCSLQEARYVLPHALSTIVYAEMSLGTLAALQNKRACVQTQTWEFVCVANQMRMEIEKKAPWASPLMKSHPHVSDWWEKTKKTPFANTHLYCPEYLRKNDNLEPQVDAENTFVYGDRTHAEMSSGPATPLLYYRGTDQVSEEIYRQLFDSYHA